SVCALSTLRAGWRYVPLRLLSSSLRSLQPPRFPHRAPTYVRRGWLLRVQRENIECIVVASACTQRRFAHPGLDPGSTPGRDDQAHRHVDRLAQLACEVETR